MEAQRDMRVSTWETVLFLIVFPLFVAILLTAAVLLAFGIDVVSPFVGLLPKEPAPDDARLAEAARTLQGLPPDAAAKLLQNVTPETAALWMEKMDLDSRRRFLAALPPDVAAQLLVLLVNPPKTQGGEAEVVRLAGELADARSRVASLEGEKADLMRQIAELQSRIRDLEVKNASLMGNLDLFRTRLQVLDGRLRALDENLATLAARKNSSTNDTTLREEIAAVRSELSQLQEILASPGL